MQRSSRPVRKYLAALDGEHSPTNPEASPRRALPRTRPGRRRGRHEVMFGYGLNCLIDMENAVILDVEATPTRISKEVDAAETMIERTEERFGLRPDHIAGDVAYGTGERLDWLVKHDNVPHLPVWDKGKRDNGTFSRQDFLYDKERDVYIGPTGKSLKTTGHLHGGKTLLYRARKFDCQQCPRKQRCCPKAPERKIPRDINEAARDHARSLNGGEAYNQSARGQKNIGRLFAEAKRNPAMTKLRRGGLSGAKDEFLLTATVQNLKRLAKLVSRPPPRPIMA